ncbi:Uncharacterised protein [Mycobacteroides abscessus subsp. abscessus]|nr:Uncharacterised protein [Mycobacteroides abscessus subsp. abscessus]SIA88543.1 Uncharacterised protein [Mycobacteroides abscessus subsp. abscessus]SIC65206.1 Uncharacterised protein [Mycobacteroides abscessus subsp. abscessus]
MAAAASLAEVPGKLMSLPSSRARAPTCAICSAVPPDTACMVFIDRV